MDRSIRGILVLLFSVFVFGCGTTVEEPPDSEMTPIISEFVGSSSCRECHARFYELWEPSLHGQAMQVFTPAFSRDKITPHEGVIQIGAYEYQAIIQDDRSWVVEKGPDGERKYPIEHALGGKNLFLLLAPPPPRERTPASSSAGLRCSRKGLV